MADKTEPNITSDNKNSTETTTRPKKKVKKKVARKKGFNWLAFFATGIYYSGKGKILKGFFLTIFNVSPVIWLLNGLYCGFKANKEFPVNVKWSWGKAIVAFIFQSIIIIGFNNFKEGYENAGKASDQQVAQLDKSSEHMNENASSTEPDSTINVDSDIKKLETNKYEMPVDQVQFIKIISEAQEKHKEVENDMQRNSIKLTRENAICDLAKEGLYVQNWIGKVVKVDATNEGKGILVVEIAKDISLRTNYSEDIKMDFDYDEPEEIVQLSSETLIEPNTELYKKVSMLKQQHIVRISGTFFSGDTKDGFCLKEGSLTLKGNLSEPEFIFGFASVDPIN